MNAEQTKLLQVSWKISIQEMLCSNHVTFKKTA